MHTGFMKASIESGFHKEPAGVFFIIIERYFISLFETAMHLLCGWLHACGAFKDALLHFLQENLSGKQLNGKMQEKWPVLRS